MDLIYLIVTNYCVYNQYFFLNVSSMIVVIDESIVRIKLSNLIF